MIHFTCDCCKRSIDLDCEVRYIVRMEIYAAIEASDGSVDEERDYLDEIEAVLERIDETDDIEDASDMYKQVRYDLCGDCRNKFLRNPLGRSTVAALDFSKN